VSGPRVLVVDDDRLVLATLSHGLAQAGYDVIDADNGDDAILLARQQRPDLALLDIRMEGKSGFDVAAYLRDASRIPFMFLSAFSDAETVARATELGAVGYLVKPLDVAQIVPQVHAVMAKIKAAALVAAPATSPATAPVASPAEVSTDDLTSMAIGVIMHRYSLGRQQAAQRLRSLAAEQGLSVEKQAERLVLAVEELARSAL
jgi:two-component system, response regulator PdtaR